MAFCCTAYVSLCAGFRTPAAMIYPRAPVTGVRKAPSVSGDGALAVPQAAGAANGYRDLVAGPDLRRSASANRLEQGCNLSQISMTFDHHAVLQLATPLPAGER